MVASEAWGGDAGVSVARDVEARDGRYFATSPWPWLKSEIDARRVAGRWVRLTYASGLLEPLARPVLRVFVGDAHADEILPAAAFGRAIWFGRIPEGATDIWISPTNQAGAFSFRVERWEVVSRRRLLAALLAADPWRGAKFVWADAIGHKKFARLQARRALGPTPLARYDDWRRSRSRRFEADGFDSPAPGARRNPHIRVVARHDRGSPIAAGRLLHSLHAQPYPDWSLVGLDGDAPNDSRASRVSADAPFADLTEGLESGDFLMPVGSDDLLPEYALAALASAARREPDVEVFYGDEDRVDADGRYRDPVLKPDWSPIFQAASPYLGVAVAFKIGFAARALEVAADLPGLALTLDPATARVGHIRRVLLTRSVATGDTAMARPERAEATAIGANANADLRACLIIPTRDRVDLLARCVASLRSHAAGACFEILVVDNGSVEDRTRTYLAALARESESRVLSSPGPFNYSALCNLAARETRAPFLVFLNNDTEVAGEYWLARMLALSRRPDIGAVGAKLLYADGAVQHAGVVLGIDGIAGHFQRRLRAADRGYFGSLAVPHEVSAVTAACLAVEAYKFAEVGGFDEVNLPVEANDVDLCLRLAERGWKTVLEPRATLIHHESASRGANSLLDQRYAKQIAYFRSRWASALCDDPYFHPALSLDALDAALA